MIPKESNEDGGLKTSETKVFESLYLKELQDLKIEKAKVERLEAKIKELKGIIAPKSKRIYDLETLVYTAKYIIEYCDKELSTKFLYGECKKWIKDATND